MEMGKTNKLKQEIEEYLTKDYCCEFKKECKDGVRVRCSEYEAKLYLILRFAALKEKRIEELVKENAELEADNDARKFAMAMSEKVEKQLRNERNTFLAQNEQYEKDLIDFNENLTKAKEIIEGLMIFCRCFAQHHTEDIRYKEAEQFLKYSEVK